MATTWNDPDETTQVFDSERLEGAASGSERWYISPDGRTKEVLAAREIIERARAGSLADGTLVWRDGLTDWTRLDAVPELMQAVRAFRSSFADAEGVAETRIMDGSLDRETSARESASKVALPVSLPPLPPIPGVGRSSGPLPPLTGANVSPRPPAQTLSGAPLPPPPSLPPLGSRKSVPDQDDEPKTAVAHAVPERPAAAQSTPSQKAREFAAGVSHWIERARPVVARYSERARVYVERDYVIPRLGRVSGRLLAAVAGALLLLIIVSLSFIGDDEPERTPMPASNTAESQPSVMPIGEQQVDPEEGLDMDDVDPKAASQPKAVSPAELKSLGPGEKAPEVTKESAARAAQRAAKSKEFDVYAAKSALSAAATKAARCKQGPAGEGSVRVKIAPSGKVASVTLTTPAFQGTAAGNCVEQVFRQATVPPFSGEEKTVFKKFRIDD